jgi:hypothetical protein
MIAGRGYALGQRASDDRGGSEEGSMQPISDMPADEFMKLQSLYASKLPMCPISTLEDTRQALSYLAFEAPKDVLPYTVRNLIEALLFIVTGALVSHRTDAEQDDKSSN